MTKTFVVLPISQRAYSEIKKKLLKAGYGHALKESYGEEVIDMDGLALEVQ